MKKIENFKDVQEFNLSSVYGGKWKDSPKQTSVNDEGCTIEKTEKFNDTNNNGIRDNNESASVCISIECPKE